MNRKILIGSAVIAITGVALVNMGITSKTDGMSDSSLANVEALAQNEDGGTSVGMCFMRSSFNGSYGTKRFCDSRTNATMIYPCQEESMNFYIESNRDRCTN